MPFGAISAKDFKNREKELDYLRGFASREVGPGPSNVLCTGARGIGKTELLKQLYREAFWEGGAAPFYYRFQWASLRAEHFARNYMARLIRQYLAFLAKDPSLAEDMGVPLGRMVAASPGEAPRFLSEMVADFEEVLKEGGPGEAVLAAVSAPVAIAARTGRRLLVMLDDFHLCDRIFERSPGDLTGAAGLFEASLKAASCPHVLAGSPEDALERIFSDDSLRGKAERLVLGPLPEDSAFSMLRGICAASGVEVGDDCLGLMRHLGGNPLYIRNLGRCLWRMQRKNAGAVDFRECYSYEVSEGETYFYWTTLLKACLGEADLRRLGMEVLRRCMDAPLALGDMGRLARSLGAGEKALRAVVASLEASGMVRASGALRPAGDRVLEDCIRCAYIVEVEGRDHESARGAVLAKRFAGAAEGGSSFEVVIPAGPEAELVAARAAEQICERMKLKRKTVEEIQFALIEACINAMEHSGSYEKKVSVRFDVKPGALEMAVESPGRPFDLGQSPEDEEGSAGEGHAGRRRGWGLRLMRRLMDEVRVERAQDRTRVVLVRNIRPEEVASGQ